MVRKKFCSATKPFLSSKCFIHNDNISIEIYNKIIEGKSQLAKKFNSNYINIVKSTTSKHPTKLGIKNCLRLIYNERISSYEELLDKDNFVSIHQKNLQKLVIEMFKTYTGMAPQIMNEVFPRNYALFSKAVILNLHEE